MTAQQLKNSILQMAVQGKLVPQDPNDEPASVLLERIRKEKEKLIKEGKIKKEKNPSYIFRGEDNLPYEKIGDNDPVCIADEVPFEIPESWEWCRLGCIGDWGSGATPSRTNPEFYDGDIPWLKTGDLNDGYVYSVPECVSKLALEKTSIRLNPAGSVLIAMYGATIGKLGIAAIPITTNQACCACLPYEGIINEYLFYFLMSQKVNFVKKGEGGAQPNISKEKIVATFFPVPPQNEQQRIIEKLKEILPKIDAYQYAEAAVNKLNSEFPGFLKKSILQQAVMGKLVPQDEKDEPAAVLLERIRAEKDALIKVGKLKKDKHESIIYRRDNSHYEKLDGVERCIDNEIPYDIPDSWQWVRLSTICSTITDGEHKTPRRVPSYEGYYLLSARNIRDGKLSLDDVDYVDINEYQIISKRCNPVKNDVLISCSGSVGRVCRIEDDNNYVMVRSAAMVSPVIINSEFLMYSLQSEMVQKQIKERTKQTAQANLFQGAIRDLLVSIPPLAEQDRIVEIIKITSNPLNKL